MKKFALIILAALVVTGCKIQDENSNQLIVVERPRAKTDATEFKIDEEYLKDAYSFIKHTEPRITIDGKSGELINDPNKFESNFDLDLIDKQDINQKNVQNLYKSKKGNNISAIVDRETGLIKTLFDIDGVVELPYGVRSDLSFAENVSKIDPRANFSSLNPHGNNKISFKDKYYSYHLSYDNGRVRSIDIEGFSDEDLQRDLVIRDYLEDMPKNESARISIENKAFSFPLTVGDLAEKLTGQIVELNSYNVDEFASDHEFVDEFFLESHLGLITEANKYLLEVDNDGLLAAPVGNPLNSLNISSIKLRPTDHFAITSDEISISNEDYEKYYKSIVKSNKDFESGLAMPNVFLDDNTFMVMAEDYLILHSTSAYSRYMSDVYDQFDRERLEEIFK